MIARLEGVLRQLEPTRVVIDVGGVGYDVHIPLSTFGALPDEGKTVALHIHTHSREGAIQLYGFATREERVAFDLLLCANRVGPKLAQTILSGISPAEFLDAIRNGRVQTLRAVPGIGTKTAERMLVELRDRAGELEACLAGAGSPGTPPRAVGPRDSVRDQALSALLNLGYSRNQAERVIDAAVAETGDDTTIENLVRGALKRLVR